MQEINRKGLVNLLYQYGVRNIPIFGISISTMIHEYGHLICSKVLGFDGYIKSGRLTSVYYANKPLVGQWTPFYLSGGLFQFTVFFLMSLRAEDENVKIANRMTAIIGLVEGLTEPIKYFRLTGLGATLGIVVSFLYLAYVLLRK
ncbi:hypothetical protein E4H04_10435 [Candidatus Bathyarchaeota archaeon]|nr:MAG: hypothetical protein E4H04_10435 [Candidatus Bathyarchaeota archaeon]